MGENKTHAALDELNSDPVGHRMVGEELLILSKEIRVEMMSRKLMRKTIEVDKFPKRNGVRRDKARSQERFWQALSEAEGE